MFNHEMILNHINDIFGHDMHAKRALSLANATLGVIESVTIARSRQISLRKIQGHPPFLTGA
ncbi:hypothetical protein ATO46_06390 [Aeromonas schubertii]|nr:hypothetical protein ATO46_06390 [Aeromonas schubertii]